MRPGRSQPKDGNFREQVPDDAQKLKSKIFTIEPLATVIYGRYLSPPNGVYHLVGLEGIQTPTWTGNIEGGSIIVH